MRAKEFLLERPIEEDKASDKTQYNSELGCMLGFISANATLEKLINGDYDSHLTNPDTVKQQAEAGQGLVTGNFEPWIQRGAAIKKATGYNGNVGWHGVGQGNQGDVADVVFEEGATHSGISIKEKSGITLTNTSPKELGFEYTGDIFQSYFKKHWKAWKTKVIDKVLAQAQHGRVIGAPKVDKDTGETIPQSGTGKIRAIQYNTDDWTDKAGKVYPAGTYSIWYGKGPDVKTWKRDAFTEEEIRKQALEGNSLMQRVFGDWYQTAIKNDQQVLAYQEKLFTEFSKLAITIIGEALTKPQALSKLLQMGEAKPYYYANDEKLYEVPGTSDASGININLQMASPIEYKQVKGTGQKFHVKIKNVANGEPGPEEYATVTLYVRYANGLFAENPTARVQELKNPEYLLWQVIK